eukprot:gene4341-6144_t
MSQGYETFNFNDTKVNNITPDISKRKRNVILLAAKIGILTVFVVVVSIVVISTTSSQKKDNVNAFQSENKYTISKTETTQPNFLFIMADDLAWNAVGYRGFDFAHITPNIDNLADDGIKIETYYTQELCSPGRTSFMTGRYPISVGMQFIEYTSHWAGGVPLEETFFPEALQSAGYTNYMLGKWNLGHYTPEYLPTARGFDYFLGYLSAATFYWSKRCSTSTSYKDIVRSDVSCYHLYDDNSTYATNMYEELAVEIIKNHDYTNSPVFMYFAPNAVHDPFYDTNYPDGLPASYVNVNSIKTISKSVDGEKRAELAKVLSVFDTTIGKLVTALKAVNQYNNTYIIFASDNGGCKYEGGKNGPLRGNKGTLFEGATKVNAFITSTLLSDYAGTKYYGLMHSTDWFPTILELAGINYTAPTGYELDGTSQVSALKGLGNSSRTNILYNMYTNISSDQITSTFDIYSDSNVAVRDSQFKLMHAWTGNALDGYDDYYTILDDDYFGYDTTEATCSNIYTMSGNYSYLLFDLINDPYETTNLYNNSDYASEQAYLEGLISEYLLKAKFSLDSGVNEASVAGKYWRKNDYYVQPWSFTTVSRSSPSDCTAAEVSNWN